MSLGGQSVDPGMMMAMAYGQMPGLMPGGNRFPSLPMSQPPQGMPQPYQQPFQGAWNPFAAAFAQQGAPNPFQMPQAMQPQGQPPGIMPTMPGPQLGQYTAQSIADIAARANAATGGTSTPAYQVPDAVTQVLQHLATAGRQVTQTPTTTGTQPIDPSIVFEQRESMGGSQGTGNSERSSIERDGISGGEGMQG